MDELNNKNDKLISEQDAIDALIEWYGCEPNDMDYFKEILAKKSPAQPVDKDINVPINDTISRQAAIDALRMDIDIIPYAKAREYARAVIETVYNRLEELPSVQPEREWIPCSNPPKHHRNVIVRGTELFGNRTVHKVMQWDVDTWRPTDYAPSIRWEEWSEI